MEYKGYFEAHEKFVPYNAVSIPAGSQAIVTILDESIQSPKQDYKVFWAEFDRMAAASFDEVLLDEDFSRINSTREMDSISEED